MDKSHNGNRKKNNHSFHRLLLSVSMVLLIPFSIAILSFSFGMKDTVFQDYLTLNGQIIDNISRSVDTAITSQTNFAYSLRDNLFLMQLSADIVESRTEKQMILTELFQYMRTIMFNNISEITALYFPKLDLVVSSQVKGISMNDFYNCYIGYDSATADEFKDALSGIEKHRYWPSQISSPYGNNDHRMMIYAQPIDMGYLLPRVYYITFIDENTLTNLVRQSFKGDIAFQLFDDNDIELIRADGVDDLWAQNALTVADKSLMTSKTYSNCRLFRVRMPSCGLQFVFYVPESAVMLRISRFIMVYMIALAGSLVIGLIIANLFSRKLHAPYEQLITAAFPDGIPTDNGSMKDGFLIVADRVREEQRINQRFREELKAYDHSEKDRVLLSLITRSGYLSYDEILDDAEMCGLPVNHARYQLALIVSDSDSDELPPLAYEGETDIVILAQKLSKRQFLVLAAYPVEKRNMLQVALDSCSDHYRIGLSRECSNLCDLSACLDDADTALKRNSNAPETEKNTYSYPIDQELKIISSVREGQFSEAGTILDDIRRINRQNLPDNIFALYDAMLATAQKITDELNGEQKPALDQQIAAAADSFNPETGDEAAFAAILDVYRNLCAYFSCSVNDKNQIIIENVRRFLNENYADPKLCLDSVAENLGVSYFFLSRIFKSVANQSFSDMLNDARIHRAMALLSGTDLSVQRVAEQVGYNNWSTFLRAFKKRTGLTPVQYRNSL